jgi:NitT/TauT family transport system permease protein
MVPDPDSVLVNAPSVAMPNLDHGRGGLLADARRRAGVTAGASPERQAMYVRLRTLMSTLEPVAVVVLVLASWEALARLGALPRASIPPVTTILGKLVSDAQTSALWLSVWQSLSAWMLGLLVVTGVAIPIGVFLGRSEVAYRLTHLLVEFVRPIPSVAALPLLILIYGTGVKLAVVLVILTAFWPLLVQTMYGVRDVDPVALDTGRAYGLNRRQLLARIVLPSALPYIATGMRLSAVLALVIAVGASLVAGGAGLGAAIANAETSGATALMYARILVAGLLGLLVTVGVGWLERRMLHWHASQRTGPV